MYDERLELRELVGIIHRHRSLVYLVVFLAFAVAMVVNLLPPTYEAVVNLRITPPVSSRNSNDTTIRSEEDAMRQLAFTYVEIVKSRTVVESAINKLYAQDTEKPKYADFILLIDAQPVKNTGILSVKVQGESAEEAQNRANALLESFTERMKGMAQGEGKGSRSIIGDRLTEAKSNLDKAEAAVIAYKEQNQTVAVMDQTRNSIDRQSNFKRMASENQLVLETAQAKLYNARQEKSWQTPGAGNENPAIQQYRVWLANQDIEMSGLLKTLTEQHPKVQNLRAAMAETKSKLNAEIVKQAESEVALAYAQRAAINRISAQVDAEVSTIPVKEQGLARLMRNYTVAEEIYITLAKRFEEYRMEEIMQSTNVQLIDSAFLPEKPVKPRILINLVAALVLGVFGGVSTAFMAEYFRKTIDSTADVQRYLGLRVIGSIPSYSYQGEKKSLWTKFRKTMPRALKSAEAKNQEAYHG